MKVTLAGDRAFVSLLIDWFSVFLPEKQHLGPKEKKFFLENVLLYNRKIDLASRTAVVHLAEALDFERETDVYRYRTKLKNKKWLVQTEVSYVIPGFFRFRNGIPKDKSLSVTLINKKHVAEGNRSAERRVLA